MASIATGLNKRGKREMYEGRYARAVELFYRAYLTEPENTDNVMDLIYALNQNADYAKALGFCYALIGRNLPERKDMLYYFTAEAFGGLGCIEACAQMLERSLAENPDGSASRDAQAFLDDVREKYTLEPYDNSVNTVSMGMMSGMTEAPFLNAETFNCMMELNALCRDQRYRDAMARLEEEFDAGNFAIALLSIGIVMSKEAHDYASMRRFAERFKFVEDYTLAELRVLAQEMTDLKDDDIAYTVYRELYGKESGEKDIAFGFAVACERIGDVKHAGEILQEVLAGDGGIGPAAYYASEIGQRSHSYLFAYEGRAVEKFYGLLKNEERDNTALEEMTDFVRFAENAYIDELLKTLDVNRLVAEMALRRLAISNEIPIEIRARMAAKLLDNGVKDIFFNTGTELVMYNEELKSVIEKLFERNAKA